MKQQDEQTKFHKKTSRFSFFGLNRQDCIRYFFGGNASLAILILVLICVFLFLQGKNFLPEYHRDLQIARGSGIDLHDMVDKQYGDIKRFIAGFNRAFTTEYYYPGRHYNDLAKTHESVRLRIERVTRRERAVLKDLEKQIKEQKENEASSPATPDGAAPTPEDSGFAIRPEEIAAFEEGIAAFETELGQIPGTDAEPDAVKEKRLALLGTLYKARKAANLLKPPAPNNESAPTGKAIPIEKLEEVRDRLVTKIAAKDREELDLIEKSSIREAREISEEEFQRILGDIRALADQPFARDRDFPLHQEFAAKRDELNKGALDEAKPLNETFLSLKKSTRPLDDLWSEIMKHAVETKTRSQTAVTVVNRIKGPFGIYRIAEEPQVRAEKLAMILKEVAEAELFHPGARLVYIATIDALVQEDITAFAESTSAAAAEKAKAVEAAAAELLEAAKNPADTEALRAAYSVFNQAGDEAQQLLMKMRSPANMYSELFHGDQAKTAFEKLKGYLESISATVPDFREKILAGTFGETEISALAAAAGEGGTLSTEDTKTLADALSNVESSHVKVVAELSRSAPDFQIPFPYGEFAEPLYEAAKNHGPIIDSLKEEIAAAVKNAPDDLSSPFAANEIKGMRKGLDNLFADIDDYSEGIKSWSHDEQQTAMGTLGAFVAGKKWTNNSAIQDRYGLLPLLTGSFIISIIAISVAVPIGVSAAIYVNQIAGHKQRQFLKPFIEFIETIPSIVLGFLGIAVLGDTLKDISESALFDWMPGLPIISRLNMLTAALLLAFMAIPTMFSLAEDALNNVPEHFRQGSLALGATNLQTAFRVMLPAALSGIIAAVLLGFGRVIGETMVVLLVAGNRISLPEMQPAIEWVGAHPATAYALGVGVVGAIVLGILVRVKKGVRGGPIGALAGLFAFFPIAAVAFFLLSLATQPSHTMTGIIAQGLGEASVGSTGWQALFMVGLVLFTISLIINYSAQKIVTSLSIEQQVMKKKKATTPKPSKASAPAA